MTKLYANRREQSKRESLILKYLEKLIKILKILFLTSIPFLLTFSFNQDNILDDNKRKRRKNFYKQLSLRKVT